MGVWQACKAQWGYDTVRLRLQFKEDLYPFYPPRLTVVRPRLRGCCAPALEAHPVLHLERWDPFLKITDLLLLLRHFLQASAAVPLLTAAPPFTSAQPGSECSGSAQQV